MGVTILQLPTKVAEITGTDGWISIIIGGVISIALGLIIIEVMKKHPNGTILELTENVFGKWVAKIATIFFILYFALLSVYVFFRSALVMQALIFPQISIFTLILLLSLPSYFMIQNDVKVLGRYSELVFYLTFWILFTFLIPLHHVHWLHLLPIVKEGWGPIFSAVKTTIFAFVGFEVAFFLYPYLQKKQEAAKGIVIANLLTMLFYLPVTILTFAYFSPDELTDFYTPVANLLKMIEFRFLERIEIIFLTFYLMILSVIWIILMFFAIYCANHLFGKKTQKKSIWTFFIMIFLYVLIRPPLFPTNDQFGKVVQYMGFYVAYLLPIFLWIVVSLHSFFKGRASK